MKKLISLILSCILLLGTTIPVFAEKEGNSKAENYFNTLSANEVDLECNLTGAYLCEASTGKVLYAQDEFKAASPASVTKIMTLLLVCEALESGRFNLTDTVRISAKAASMGGSQVFLEEGEKITVEELIKAAIISSGNDASVALAELTAGSESAFVNLMNKRAAELGLKNTNFENATGLDDTTTKHYSCAADIATMSRELISHDIILKYSSIWQDTIRNGEFTLTNTNRLVRYYEGCNGLKTGSTEKAGFCVSVTAERDGMTLICVIMGAETRDIRNAEATRLLDWGFATYGLFHQDGGSLPPLPVTGGRLDAVTLNYPPFNCVLPKADIAAVESSVSLPPSVSAPIRAGEAVGKLTYTLRGETIGEVPISASQTSERLGYGGLWLRMLRMILGA